MTNIITTGDSTESLSNSSSLDIPVRDMTVAASDTKKKPSQSTPGADWKISILIKYHKKPPVKAFDIFWRKKSFESDALLRS